MLENRALLRPKESPTMKLTLPSLAAASLLAAAATLQAQTTGVSHPEELNDTITTSAPAPSHYVEPSAGTPVATAQPVVTAITETTTTSNATTLATAPATEEAPAVAVLHTHDAEAVASPPDETAVVAKHEMVVDPNDPNSGVVLERPTKPNELPEGTLLHAALNQTLSSAVIQPGDKFTARLTADVMYHGRVFIPRDSLVFCRVTEVRAGKAFGHAAMMRLQPDTLQMTDGTRYPLAAAIIDFDKTADAHRDSHVGAEGAITADRHTREKLAALSLTTGSAAVAGAVLGGGVGAVVGAGIGAGAGLVWWSKQDHDQTLASNTGLVLQLNDAIFFRAQAQTASLGR
jgi:hypothetical protein